MCRVVRLNEIKPGCRRGNAAPRSVAGLEDLQGPLGRGTVTAHSRQDTSDVPHHVKQERVGLDVNHYQRTVTYDLQHMDSAYGRSGLTSGTAKRAEVVLPEQVARRGPHAVEVEVPGLPSHAIAQHGWPDRTVV